MPKLLDSVLDGPFSFRFNRPFESNCSSIQLNFRSLDGEAVLSSGKWKEWRNSGNRAPRSPVCSTTERAAFCSFLLLTLLHLGMFMFFFLFQWQSLKHQISIHFPFYKFLTPWNRFGFSSIEKQRQRLPVYKYRSAILYLVETHATTIIVGETGSGKTTQIPQVSSISLHVLRNHGSPYLLWAWTIAFNFLKRPGINGDVFLTFNLGSFPQLAKVGLPPNNPSFEQSTP